MRATDQTLAGIEVGDDMDPAIRQLIDRTEILELGARATRLLNDQQIDAYCDLYTEDGSFEAVGFPAAKGRAAIKEMMRMSPGVIHMTLDPVVEIFGDEASVESNLLGMWASADGQKSGFLETGRYRDELVRGPLGWRLKRRSVSLDMSADKVFARLQEGAGTIDPEQWREACAARWVS